MVTLRGLESFLLGNKYSYLRNEFTWFEHQASQ